jgi:predicted nucleic acid-binding protein
MAYFDTTVLVAYYCPEELSEHAERLILNDDEPTISMLTVLEFVSALSRKTREKALSSVHAKTICKQFDHHRKNGYYVVKSIDAAHYLMAASFIQQFTTPLRTLDALHIAIAVDAALPILTADKQFARSAEKLGADCRLVK